MQKSIDWFIHKKLLLKDKTIKNLAKNYMKKARNNIITMELLDKTINFRDILGLPEDYDPKEWVIISGYYSMYMAALGILSLLGYKSRNHTATILALETLLVKKKLLEKEYLEILERIKINKEEIEELDKVRDKREIAQYSITKEMTKNIAEEVKNNAHKFANKMEELFDLLGNP